ncbi:DUF2076 domain-containing protein [Pandoraea sputorum]|uniref:Uncharacterized protein conserved in bacteria (DUF2076) n=1 Tax=Pandoraea sputorum TaxID=93222 RepID=A0A239T1T9_9BURK|nr:DUF2076 domain-containing protein [Pandoraea sputorum]AJC15463.1 hypothetical protein NA29_04290 [Pandoraea sputorum]BET12485.1 DUF2076 domain-containing protein [Pandoraea sputorum]SNU90803.1 Uncharacterized protein conserved in bacteria (DUF2076) [Pandoraea sputorum]VVD75635.1 hypothetical protein PSP20601_00847 [Pandoraea sputorum]
MDSQEMQTLQSFLTQLTQAQAGVKDAQAEALIADAVRRQPDAAYLLVQRALLLDHALVSARAQISTLQSQLQAAQGGAHDSFLGGANAWGNGGAAGNGAGTTGSMGNGGPVGYNPNAAPASYPAQMQAPTQVASQPQAPAQRSGWLSDGARGTLGSIATTAAGVAGGAFLFQGIESLFHRNGGGGFFGQPAMGGLGSGMMPSETIVNNTIYENGNGNGNGSGSGSDNFLDTSNSDFSNIDDSLTDTGDYDDDSNFI